MGEWGGGDWIVSCKQGTLRPSLRRGGDVEGAWASDGGQWPPGVVGRSFRASISLARAEETMILAMPKWGREAQGAWASDEGRVALLDLISRARNLFGGGDGERSLSVKRRRVSRVACVAGTLVT